MVMVECPRCGEKSAAGKKCAECGLMLDKTTVDVPLAGAAAKDSAEVDDRVKKVDPKKRVKLVESCLECREEKPILGRGLCSRCYQRLKKEGTLEVRYPRRTKKRGDVSMPASRKSAATSESFKRSVAVVFAERDMPLFVALEKISARERRSVADQVLCLLEEVLVAGGNL